MNNTPDYDNNLAFEPKIPVYPYSWGDLVEHCRNKDLFDKEPTADYFNIGVLSFHKDGIVRADGIMISKCTYTEMKTIIEALWGE